MPGASRDGRRLTGYVTTDDGTNGRIHHQSLYDDDGVYYDHGMGGDVDVYEEEMDDDEGSVGSMLSIPDPNIDFDLVYALHTFAATVEGQASVVKGDALTLLDDSNSYWWLVKVLKTSEVGYIPAENIETPYERLARLNSHRNIELTQRVIQDAFPVPPSKPKNTKRVTLAKGVKFQAQVIFGSSDDEDFEEEYEEWQETIRSDTDTDNEDTTTTDSSDYDDYYDDVHLYSSAFGQDLQQPQPSPPQQQQQQHQHQHQQHYRSTTFRDTLDLEASETRKISLTPLVARGRDEYHQGTSYQSQEEKSNNNNNNNKLDLLLNSNSDEPTNATTTPAHTKEKKEKSGLRKLFSRNKSKDKKKKQQQQQQQRKGSVDKQSITESILSETASTSSQSITTSSGVGVDSGIDTSSSLQPVMLKIFAGNDVRFLGEAAYKIAHVYPSTTTVELIQEALDTFDIEDCNTDPDAHLDYFITVKGVDGDEYTLDPMDKPLAIYESLTAHLNTPMPSLRKARRISQLMGSSTSGDSSSATHMGGPKENQEERVEEVRFYLSTKAKKNQPEEGYVAIKVSLFAADHHQTGSSNGILKPDQTRLDKLVNVPAQASVAQVTSLLLEKFHVLNGVVDGMDVESLRVEGGPEGNAVRYQLTVCIEGQEHPLVSTDPIINAFGASPPPIQHRRSSINPDRRTSIASLSAVITPPPQPDETFFILRRCDPPTRPPRPLRQNNTPMPKQADTISTTTDTPTTHPLEHQQQREIAAAAAPSPIDTMLKPPQQQVYEEPESAVDVLQKLDEALDHLNHTRNSNEPLTEAITNQFGSAAATTAQQQQGVVEEEQPTEAVKSSSRATRQVESILFSDDFGMNELMILIRGATRYAEETEGRKHVIRSEISEVYKETYARLDQLEKELDRLLALAVKVYL